ncbi:MAG TPA: peptide-methionine (S)-S-oxide reductase MsrA [Candidatus Baltobacteraceae bacterium]|nr:peptide-methionine (S)-S-oxide reductase MsrA [Candidatus Baltobacteraceae bacterium]
MSTQIATFAAGCFWGVEAAFRGVPGVIDAVSGYTGGSTQNPTYREVCTDRTGHAEAVEVRFDPSEVSYEHLLDIFWKIHDPTQINRQGPDYGTQYRSAIFTHSLEQAAAAAASREREEIARGKKIATQIVAAPMFFRAENYHQRYFERNGALCQVAP